MIGDAGGEAIARLTPEMISRSRVVAKGNRIRDVRRLVKQYGGKASKWVKKSSPTFLLEDQPHEIHWYEHEGLGRFELKLKEVGYE